MSDDEWEQRVGHLVRRNRELLGAVVCLHHDREALTKQNEHLAERVLELETFIIKLGEEA